MTHLGGDMANVMKSGNDIAAALAAVPDAVTETFLDIAQTLAGALEDMGRPRETADMEAFTLALAVAVEHGGSCLYIPKGTRIRKAMRDRAIVRLYDGTVAGPCGVKALARRFDVTEQHIYRVLRETAAARNVAR